MKVVPAHVSPQETVKDRVQEDPRRRLMQAASEVFAETGYQAATVREICARAGQNVAAVNYHFGDKYALYTEVLKEAVQPYTDAAAEAAFEDLTPEEGIRRFVQNVLRLVAKSDRVAWHTRLMMHEMAAPTQGLAAVVELVMRPKVMSLAQIVGRFLELPPTHPKTRLCVHSVMGQVVHYVHARSSFALLWPDWKLDAAELEVVADHIADFSIAGLRAMKKNLDHETAGK